MSWLDQAWRLFRLMPRPIDYRDIADRTGMSELVAQKCVCELRRRHCIVLVGGSARTGRRYMPVEGAELVREDRRGRTDAAKAVLERARAARRRKGASRPVSQVTVVPPAISRARG